MARLRAILNLSPVAEAGQRALWGRAKIKGSSGFQPIGVTLLFGRFLTDSPGGAGEAGGVEDGQYVRPWGIREPVVARWKRSGAIL